MRLPKPGIVGQYDDPQHMRSAAEHVERFPDHTYTEAYLDLARRGRQLLEKEEEDENR